MADDRLDRLWRYIHTKSRNLKTHGRRGITSNLENNFACAYAPRRKLLLCDRSYHTLAFKLYVAVKNGLAASENKKAEFAAVVKRALSCVLPSRATCPAEHRELLIHRLVTANAKCRSGLQFLASVMSATHTYSVIGISVDRAIKAQFASGNGSLVARLRSRYGWVALGSAVRVSGYKRSTNHCIMCSREPVAKSHWTEIDALAYDRKSGKIFLLEIKSTTTNTISQQILKRYKHQTWLTHRFAETTLPAIKDKLRSYIVFVDAFTLDMVGDPIPVRRFEDRPCDSVLRLFPCLLDNCTVYGPEALSAQAVYDRRTKRTTTITAPSRVPKERSRRSLPRAPRGLTMGHHMSLRKR